MKRYLITTADERSWKFDRPVLFLGAWCRLYLRREKWLAMDAVVAAPYGITSADKDRDLAYVNSLTSELLREAVIALNKLHGTAHANRYWHIVIGQWLHRFTSVAFNRYRTVEQTLKNYDISGTTVFEASDYRLAASDSLEFIWACNDDEWNHVFYADVIRDLGGVPTEVDRTALTSKTGFVQPASAPTQPVGVRAKSLA